MTPQGNVTTVAGMPGGESQGSEVRLHRPVGLAVTHDGFLYVSDEGSGKIIRITPEGSSQTYSGSISGFVNAAGESARFNGPTSIVVDRQGVLYVADSENYLIREIVPSLIATPSNARGLFVQPPDDSAGPNSDARIPELNASVMGVGQSFPWPLSPQGSWHEIAGVVGEARGAAGGIALDHLHSGLDIHGNAGEAALSVFDEKVSSPLPNWGFDGAGEGIHIGLFSYIHVRVGRNGKGDIEEPEKFKARINSAGATIDVRVRRGTRFKVGNTIGSLNRLNHVHLNLGPWNAQSNPLVLPFFALKDTVPPTIEGIEILPAGAPGSRKTGSSGTASSRTKQADQPVISGDVAIVVTAYDRVDGNGVNRKLGLFKIGYQLLHADGGPVKGFEQPLMNIEFSRLPAEDASVVKAYAPGSGVSAYGTPTMFRYIVTNKVRDGDAQDGVLRTSSLAPGVYVIKVIAEDFAGNRAAGPSTELVVTVRN